METRLYHKERIRISVDHKHNTFVDVSHLNYECLSVDFYAFNYHELRQKEDHIKMFSWDKKAYKKELDFGWWEDAEVVWSFNREGKDKK